MIAATVLTAGASSRMGSPKALLMFRGLTFLENILATAKLAGLDRVVVLGHHAAKIKEGHDLNGVEVVYNEELDAGPIGSIRAAVRAVFNRPVEAVLVWPVDYPHVSLDTIRALIAQFDNGPQPIVVPTYHGQRGHPVVFGQEVFAELLAAAADQGARAVVLADPSRVANVPVADAAVIDSVNTPQAYRQLLKSFRDPLAES